jgi:Histidine kinase-, DNA gyrase B-, and HSP90-like ATPase
MPAGSDDRLPPPGAAAGPHGHRHRLVTDPKGRLLDIVPRPPSIVGRNFAFRDWYRGVTTTNRSYVSEAYETAATGNARVVGAAVQVRAPATGGRPGRVLGIVVAAERQITVHAPPAGGRTWTVHADRQRLKQVLLNLASNAVKYHRPAGTIRVACQATPGGRVAVEVADTGPDLSADKLARRFTPSTASAPSRARSRAPAWAWRCPRG